ncbi:DNA-binding transcriptional regulator, LysR family [Acinetobacter marinus]|uniref:DNA-binding transcriptional regulator, LysR family n=1 Tax=Acinetobacter marinus TaxID=281375 RepID=A0A1G6NPA4_9GAMM|nr:LysR substrate-binding domain-containing protein [Acinetobacter marinus]SDC69117.1 DNA-binding transcriptional regulator, LysR family [Acinetobacter marinus]
MFAQLPSLKALKSFESAARLHSFKLAAQELSVSQTAISHQIRLLEDQLSIKLFHRQTRAVSLTPQGEILAQSVRQSLAMIQHSLEQIASSANTLTISTTHAFAAMWLVPRLSQFQQLHPEIDVQIRANDQLIDIEHDLNSDLAIRYGAFSAQENTQENSQRLCADHLQCVATPSYWQHLAEQTVWKFLCVKLKNKNLKQLDYEQAISSFLKTRFDFEIQYFEDEMQVYQAALAGQGIAILNQMLITQSLENEWLSCNMQELSAPLEGLDYYTMIPKRSQDNEAVQVFCQWLEQQTQTRPRDGV